MRLQRRSSPEIPHVRPRVGAFWLAALFALLFGGLGWRAYDLQARRQPFFKQLLHKSHVTNLPLIGRRGDIYDRHLQTLAASSEVDSLSATPSLIQEKLKRSEELSKILSLPKQKVLLKLAHDGRDVSLKRFLTPEETQKIQEYIQKNHLEKVKIKDKEGKTLKEGAALYLVKESKRFYPHERLGAHVIGFTDQDGKGLGGIEKQLEPFLSGRKIVLRVPRDPKGRYLFRPEDDPDGKRWGSNVVLSLDKNIQYMTDNVLQKAVERARAKRGMAVVMDPYTGDVLALSVQPDFDLNLFSKISAAAKNNAAISDPFEPGSTMKAISLAVGLQKKAFTIREVCDRGTSRFRIGRKSIGDDHYNPKKNRFVTPLLTMAVSSNICTAKFLMRLKREEFYEGLRDFGFGQTTGIGLPGESRGILHHYKKWAEISFANIAFGQGMSLTALQMATAVSVIANGGQYFRPRLVLGLVDRQKRFTHRIEARPLRRVLSEATAREIRKMMDAVTSHESGTGHGSKIEGTTVGGKTGTAQKPIAGGRGYGKERIGSFVGFFPSDRPKYVIFIAIDEPQGNKYGGEVAGKPFSELGSKLLQLSAPLPAAASVFPAR